MSQEQNQRLALFSAVGAAQPMMLSELSNARVPAAAATANRVTFENANYKVRWDIVSMESG